MTTNTKISVLLMYALKILYYSFYLTNGMETIVMEIHGIHNKKKGNDVSYKLCHIKTPLYVSSNLILLCGK